MKEPKKKNTRDTESNMDAVATVYMRWAAFQGAVLSKLDDPEQCRKTILARQAEVDDETNEADLVSAYFRMRIEQGRLNPEKCCVYWPTPEVAEWLAAATGNKIPVTRATPYLRTLAIPELRYTKKNGVPGWVWRGRKAPKNEPSIIFAKRHQVPRENG